MDNISDVAVFVQEHFKPWAAAEFSRLHEYFTWYAKLGILGVAYRRQHDIAAVITCRAFNDPEDYRNEFVHRPWGKYVRCSVYGAIAPIFIPVAVWEIAQRHDMSIERIYLWHRDENEIGPPRQYNAQQFKRILRKLMKI